MFKTFRRWLARRIGYDIVWSADISRHNDQLTIDNERLREENERLKSK